MTSFSKSALEMLQAAEEALAQPRGLRSMQRPPTTAVYAYKSGVDYGDKRSGCTTHFDPNTDNGVGAAESTTVRELQRQLSSAMRELIELRAELAAERDRRNDTLVALGRQWKEEVMVAVHRRDAALHADVAALEEAMKVHCAESGERHIVVRRQLEESARAAKVRDNDRFQLREELEETTRQVEERVEVALAQSTAARADCSRQLEQARADLSQRLDTELLRLVEMRREDQRALQEAKEAVRQDGQRMRDEVRRAVQEVWESSAAALIRTATEPVEQLRAELRQCRAAVQGAEEKVADCVRSCQAESRLHTTATAERLHALESKEAVAASRLDRAERKADGAYEVVHQMEASVQAARDATERAQVQAASALERTQRVEHSLSDRDGRLIAVESQLHAVSTAEGLKAEVEACKRQASRLESRMDAAGALCERVEQLADRTVRQVNDFAERIGNCEKSVQRSGTTVQDVHETVVACQAECQEIRTRHEASEGVVQRHGLLMTQLEQRIMGQENRLGLWRRQQEQHIKDQQTMQREMTERAEVTHAMATRAQQVSSDARAGVSRLERRFDDVDRALASGTTDATALRAAVESLRSQSLEVQRQQQQQEDQLKAMESRMQERVAPLADLERNVAQCFERSEALDERLSQKVAQCEKQIQEMGGRVQDYVKDAIRHHVGESQRRLLSALNEGLSRLSERVKAAESAVTALETKSGDTPQQLQSLHESVTAQQRSLESAESRLQALRGHVEQLSLHADAQSGDHQQLGKVQQDMTRLGAAQQRLQQDLLQLREMVQTLREVQLMAGGPTRDPTLSIALGGGGSQTQTASTEMAGTTHGADSSSLSARIPQGAGECSTTTSLPTASHAGTVPPSAAVELQPQPQHHQAQGAPATPPLVSSSTKAAPTLQAQQQRRASSNSTEGSKGSSMERPPSHLSGVSSVQPTEEEVVRLHSIAEPAAGTDSRESSGASHSSSGSGGAVVAVRGSPAAATVPPAEVAAAPRASAAIETAEKLSAPAVPPSAQVSGLANTSHQTVIRGFTTIASSSSDSDTEDGRDDDAHPQKQPQQQQQRRRVARAEEHTDDMSSDLTTAVTLTSETAATPQRGTGGRRVRPSTAQQRHTVAIAATAAWGHASSDSSAESTPAAPARVAPDSAYAGGGDGGKGEQTNLQSAADAPATSGAAVQHRSSPGQSSNDSDVVQAVGVPTSSSSPSDEDDSGSEGVRGGSVVPPPAYTAGGNAWAKEQPVTPTHSQQQQQQAAAAAAAAVAVAGQSPVAENTESSVPEPRHPEWDDWDEEESEGEEGDSSAPAGAPVRTAGADSDDDASDMVVQMNQVEEVVELQPQMQQRQQQQQTDSTVSSSSTPVWMAATTMHHRTTEAATGTAEELRPTQRRTFLGSGGVVGEGSPEPRHVVPRHGQNTTSSSSSSAERAEALGLRVGGATAQGQRPAPQVRHYTSFDDSTTSEDE
jgi:predicted  nucleic acid-binding Zn-ribbon protein